MKIISVEAIDGAGKTTLVAQIKQYVEQTKDPFWKYTGFTRFPTSAFYHQYSKRKASDLTDAEVLRMQDEDKRIEIERNRGYRYDVLICDRGELTQIVYNKSESPSMRSDVIVFLDIPVEESLIRIHERNDEDILGFEKETTLRDMHSEYNRLIGSKDFRGKLIVVDVTDIDYRGQLADCYEAIHGLMERIKGNMMLLNHQT